MGMLDDLSKLKPETRNQVFKFFDKIGGDAELHEIAYGLLIAQDELVQSFKAHEQVNLGDYTLMDAQHPYGAVISGSRRTGDRNDPAGGRLSLRNSASIIFEQDGTPTEEFLAFDALLDVKHMSEVIHQKDNKNAIYDVAYDFFRAGCQPDDPENKLPAGLRGLDKILIDDARNYFKVFAQAERRAAHHYYNDMGIDVASIADDERKLKLGVAIEDLLREKKLYDAMPSSEHRAMRGILLDEFAGEQYLYVDDTKKFVRIPSLDGDPIKVGKDMQAFLAQLPGYDSKPGEKAHEWQELGHRVAVDYTDYLKQRELFKKQDNPHLKVLTVITCSDSRTTAATTIGAQEARDDTSIRMHRTAGCQIVDKNGEPTKSIQRLVAITKMRGGSIIMDNHGGCGAVEISESCNSGNWGKWSPSFHAFANTLKNVYDTVKAAGSTPADIVKVFKDKSGIRFKSPACVMSWLKTEKEAQIVEKLFGAPIYRAFANTPETQNYLGIKDEKNPNEYRYIAVDHIDGLLAQVAPQRVVVTYPNPTREFPKHNWSKSAPNPV